MSLSLLKIKLHLKTADDFNQNIDEYLFHTCQITELFKKTRSIMYEYVDYERKYYSFLRPSEKISSFITHLRASAFLKARSDDTLQKCALGDSHRDTIVMCVCNVFCKSLQNWFCISSP